MDYLLKKIISTGIIILLIMPVMSSASISYEVSYDISLILFDKMKSKDLIRIKDIEITEEIGEPMLPFDCINLLLPEGEVAESVAVEVEQPYVLPGNYSIMPCPDFFDSLKDTINTLIYSSATPYPGRRARIIRGGSYGRNNIVQIAVYPMDYFPKESEVVFYDNIRLTIHTKFSGKQCISQRNRTQYSDNIVKKALKSIVDNDYDISSYPYNTRAEDTSEYIIITNDSLSSGYESLANYLKKKGVIAEIVTVDYIVSSGYHDEVSSLNDAPGAIRGFLTEKYNEGAIWVLLGGDEDVVPVRYGTSERNDTSIDYRAPSDLYYSDLNGNWNVDGDEFYGEPIDDSVDVFPELYVGRIPCNTLQEVSNWFEKLVGYETDPGKGEADYLTKFLWTGADDVREGPEYIIKNAQLPGYVSHDTTMLEVEPEGVLPKGSDVINKMNEHFGLFTCFGHGSPPNITVSAPGKNSPSPYRNFLVSVDSVDWKGNCRNDPGNGLDSLKNKNYYGILNTCSCFQAAFDYEKFPGRFIIRGPSMGEAFILLPERGGPAFRGYTRYGGGYAMLGGLEIDFLDNLFADKITSIGVAEALSKNESPSYFIQINHTLLGCPLMRVWTDVPEKMKVYHDKVISPGTKNMIITVIEDGSEMDIMDAYVCLWKENEVYKRGYTDSNGDLLIQVDPATEGLMSITVTKENMLPYEGEVLVQSESAIETDRIYENYIKLPSPIITGNIVLNVSSNNDRKANIELIDITGRIAEKKNLNLQRGKKDIKLGEFSSGIYFLRILSGEGSDPEVQKITVLR